MQSFLSEYKAIKTFDLVLILTLLLLLLHPGDALRVKIPMTVLVLLACISSALRKDPRFWFVVASTFIMANLKDWFQLDNHKYLMGYWCIAIFCCLNTKDPEKALAINGRLLIGISFLLAVVWKSISNDYLDGSFFHYTLLIDERFRGLSKSLSGVTDDMSNLNSAALNALINYDSNLSVVQLQSTPRIYTLASLITWWTFGIEAIIAAVFLLPQKFAVTRWCDYILIMFMLSTYAVARVIGFGWLLAVMGLAQANPKVGHIRLLYLGVLIALQIYRIPWQSML